MNKTIIAVCGTANVGKSMTLSSLGRQLHAAGGITTANINQNEYRAIFSYRGINLGVQTFGDREHWVREGLDQFLVSNCHLIAIASKAYGATVNTLGRFASQNGFRLIWTRPYEVRDNSIPTPTIKDYGASHLLLMVNDIISGNL